ncbi:unnamed protein product [Clonostachys rosea f. rosea IK726]|uniref:Major facilitator superfamily (MFS) profile domain-containing protein n=2 Tax=Bionectria ochroleuca TaxID=29856 RepID=A0A0B7KA18_BIOOC|nr:unnamed protein product [Clonostachys rosea f. rosea IK726]
MTSNDDRDSPPRTSAEKAAQPSLEKTPSNTVTEPTEGDEPPKVPDQKPASDDSLMPLPQLFLTGLGLWFAVFLITLDGTIVANAAPRISDEFHALSDVGWFGSAYALTTAAFQLLYGRIYSCFSIKYTFMVAVGFFELGSLICALAPNSIALIIGRAVQGLGGAGINSGVMIIISQSVPVRLRPVIVSSMGIVFAISSVLGPLLGGVFTSKLTWRWCFYINLPFGAFTALTVLLFLRLPARPQLASTPLREKLKNLDLIGLAIFLPAVISLLLAMQWGGSEYAWSNARIIALLVLFGVLGIAFLFFEYWKGADASFPFRMITRRNMAAAAWNGFLNGGAFPLLVYYIPLWHQVIKEVDAVQSGIRLLPLILGVVVCALLAGALVSKFGYYNIFMILGSIILPIGEGLLTTWNVDTPFSQWVGYQAMIGIGIGFGQQQPMIAIQTLLPRHEIPSGTAVIQLLQTLSGAIFISVGQSVLQNELLRNLKTALPNANFDASVLTTVGATQVRNLVPPEDLPAVLEAYNDALTRTYLVAVVVSSLTIFGSLAMEWKNVAKPKAQETKDVEAAKQENATKDENDTKEVKEAQEVKEAKEST